MNATTQDHRHAAIETPLGKDRLLLKSFSGREELGRLFEYHLVLLDKKGDVDGDDLVGTNVSVRLEVETGATRYFNGFISAVAFLGYESGMGVYHAEFVPWLWMLTRTSDCRSFQEKTVPDILREVFSDHGFQDFKFDLRRTYRPRVFCVQYNESSFNFVSRLMEHEGMYYYWKHENGRHVMMIVDDMAVHIPHPDRADIEWRANTGIPQDGYLYDMRVQKTVSTGAFAHSDYNFKKPASDLRKKKQQEKRHAAAKFELFEFPGQYRDPEEGDELAALRLEEAQAEHEVIDANVTARAVSCGYYLRLKRAERTDQARRYLITSTSIVINQDAYATGGGSSGNRFECKITGIPDSGVYRPHRITAKPVMRGPQTGLVVGPAGEEIYTDEHGRIKVHFYWDRRSTANDKSSKWVRVSQPAAGGGYGFVSIPRIGQEVMVEFIEGDPDRPVVTGCFYNGDNKPPYSLPGEKTKTVWKSNSSKGGGGYNEIRFEDSKSSEQIFVHGQKDMDVRIEEECRTTIGTNAHTTIGVNSSTDIGSNMSLNVGANQSISVGSNQSVSVGGNEMVSVGGSSSTEVGKDVLLEAGMNIHSDAGKDIFLKAGMNIVIEAGMSITLAVGGNFINISPAGVAIKGTMVLINSGGAKTPGTKVSKQKPEKPKKPKPAKNSQSGRVESAKGMGHASNPQNWKATTVSDIAAREGAPFYGGGAAGGTAGGQAGNA